ncbi:Solute carrier organic anion transporter family member 4A1 [Nymphon striatum]|nr:Solute carrier organic anion transporter family member 4A1 [Nymphon striatum]
MIIDKSNGGGLLSTSEPILDREAYPEITLPSSVSQEPLVFKPDSKIDTDLSYSDDKSETEKLNSLEHSSSDTHMISQSPSDADEELCKCGWWSMRPKFLQKFNTPKWVLVFLCMSACFQGLVVNGFVNVVITSIERRFEIKSTDSGVIAGSYDIGTLICLIPVTYFGGHASKPLLIGGGMVIAGVGSFIFSLPHFATESYTFR